jgi:hypothetical protein
MPTALLRACLANAAAVYIFTKSSLLSTNDICYEEKFRQLFTSHSGRYISRPIFTWLLIKD